jgi:hypothetical protein
VNRIKRGCRFGTDGEGENENESESEWETRSAYRWRFWWGLRVHPSLFAVRKDDLLLATARGRADAGPHTRVDLVVYLMIAFRCKLLGTENVQVMSPPAVASR